MYQLMIWNTQILITTYLQTQLSWLYQVTFLHIGPWNFHIYWILLLSLHNNCWWRLFYSTSSTRSSLFVFSSLFGPFFLFINTIFIYSFHFTCPKKLIQVEMTVVWLQILVWSIKSCFPTYISFLFSSFCSLQSYSLLFSSDLFSTRTLQYQSLSVLSLYFFSYKILSFSPIK